MASSKDPPNPNRNEKWNFKFNPFKVLGVSSDNPDPEEIRKAYYSQIRASHPDKAGGKEGLAKKLNVAYSYLKDRDAEKLKKIATFFDTASGAQSLFRNDRLDLSHVLVDKTKAEYYRRLFEDYVNVARFTHFKDNFQSFYGKVFGRVSTQLEVKVGYHCSLCKEDFLKEEHHAELVVKPYKEYVLDGGKPGYKEHLENMLGKEVVDWEPPNNHNNGTGDNWRERFSTAFQKWCELLKPIKDDALEWTGNVETIGKIEKESTTILICLFLAVDLSEEEICNALVNSLPQKIEIGAINSHELVLTAFLHVIKKFKGWRNLSMKMVTKSPSMALCLAYANIVIDRNAEDNFHQLGESLIKSAKHFDYAHFFFQLGSCDLNYVAIKILSFFPSSPEAIQLAAYFLAKTKDVEKLQNLLTQSIQTKDVSTSRIFALALFRYHWFEKKDADSALRKMATVFSAKKFWKFLQAFAVECPEIIKESEVIAELTVKRIMKKLENESLFDSFVSCILGQEINSESGLLKPLPGALHILHRDKERHAKTIEIAMTWITSRLDLQVVNGSAQCLLELVRIPGIFLIFQEILENNKFLGRHAPKTQPGSRHDTGLLILRAVYHFKTSRFADMAYDLLSAAMHTPKENITISIATFLTSNPLIHEKILKEASTQFKKLKIYIENYIGECVEDANFLEILQKPIPNKEPYFSASFYVSKDKKSEPDVAALEKDILGRDDDDDFGDKAKRKSGTLSATEYAEKAFEYTNLEVICKGVDETICCLTMAGHYFLQAMLACQERDIPQKFAYRGLIMECMGHLENYVNLFQVPVPLSLHSLRAILSFIFRANQHFSEVLRKTRRSNGSTPYIDEIGISEHSDNWQMLLNLRLICPLITSDIFTIAEGVIPLFVYRKVYMELLKEKICRGFYSKNTPDFLYHHMLFNHIWGEQMSPELSGYEDEIPSLEILQLQKQMIDEKKDSKKEKAEKRKLNEKIGKLEEKHRIREETRLIDRIGFKATRENAMISLAKFSGYDLTHLEAIMNWPLIRRTPEGFIDMENRTLNFDGVEAYTRFVGIEMNRFKETCNFLLEPAVHGDPKRPPLFSALDLAEIFGHKVWGGMLTFKDQAFPPGAPDCIKMSIPFHPFFETVFHGNGPMGASKESICGTNFLMTMYHLDLLGKMLTTGQEVGANFPFPFINTEANLLNNLSKELQTVLKPIGQRITLNSLKKVDIVRKFWFEIENVEQQIVPPFPFNGMTEAFRFGKVSVVLKTERMMIGDEYEGNTDNESLGGRESAEASFVKGFNDQLHLIEKEFPIIQRMKELAKISQCVGILHSNRELFEDDIPTFRDLMELQLPHERPFSKCGGAGTVCRCRYWVPALYHQMKVTDEQKIEYLRLKSFETDRHFPEENIRRLRSTNCEKSDSVNNGLENKTTRDGSLTTSNLEAYDGLMTYKVFGGVAFVPDAVPAERIPISETTIKIAWNNVIIKDKNYFAPKLDSNGNEEMGSRFKMHTIMKVMEKSMGVQGKEPEHKSELDEAGESDTTCSLRGGQSPTKVKDNPTRGKGRCGSASPRGKGKRRQSSPRKRK